jgi:methionyl-tRNA formyltransferase
MAQLIKTIFFGTSEFAVPALEILIKEGYEITAVITNPDEPTGRKQVPTPPPVKIAAQKFGLRILQPEKLKGNQEFFSELKNLLQTTNYPSSRAKLATGHGKLQTSIGIVASYGKIIPKEIINTFKHGILNIHPSLLPKYRGPTPIQSAILSGGQETGVTIIKIDEQIDHGPILINQKSKIKILKNRKASWQNWGRNY